jgi:D-inositol-3-phosphate glycosyltransferase
LATQSASWWKGGWRRLEPVIQIREDHVDPHSPIALPNLRVPNASTAIAVALLTGGIDRPYVFGLVMELISKGAALEVIGSDNLDFVEFHDKPSLTFLNLQGSQRPDVSLLRKVFRISLYYAKLIRYAATAKPRIFHILWNNKFDLFDRTLLMLYFKSLGKRIVLTVHNVNARKRDSEDTYLNRLTLQFQYRLADHIFVHTETGKVELNEQFGVDAARVSVIPFGINNAVPQTTLTRSEAKRRLGIQADRKVILFFGRITPYKGLDYLVTAFQQVLTRHPDFQLVVAGRPENACRSYWEGILQKIEGDVRKGRILLKAEHIPDDETEVYFKAADVLVLPYRQIYQSGVLFLGYSFGLPILAADLGPLKEEIVEGKTGFVFEPEDPTKLATAIERYFSSDLFADLEGRQQEIRNFATQRHSWNVVGQMIMSLYTDLLRSQSAWGTAE